MCNQPEESISVALIPAKRVQKLPHLGCRWFDLRRLAGELIDRYRDGVATPFVIGHRLFKRTLSGETLVDGFGEQFSVAEGISYSRAGAGILLVSSIADQRPTVAERLAKKTIDRGTAPSFFSEQEKS
ncbi:MAG: hypothetical protein JO121_19540 [Deltaproteobacteria bacterium]|nr:hypothetical protein [Deltaproteobacteria bacterium]